MFEGTCQNWEKTSTEKNEVQRVYNLHQGGRFSWFKRACDYQTRSITILTKKINELKRKKQKKTVKQRVKQKVKEEEFSLSIKIIIRSEPWSISL